MPVEKRVPFSPRATTIYLSGAGRPFKPGSNFNVPESHLSNLQAADERAAERIAARQAATDAAEKLAAAKSAEATVDKE